MGAEITTGSDAGRLEFVHRVHKLGEVPDHDPLELAARFRRALMPLVRELRRQVEGDMTPGLMSALGTVAREEPITLGDLAAAERVTPPMATKLANGLGDRGLVERIPGTDDRRVVRLALTPAGREVLDRARQRRNAWLAEQFSNLDADELAAIAEAVAVIERLTRQPEPAR
jgi:DNA-binding MarR family transcriptional regulator